MAKDIDLTVLEREAARVTNALCARAVGLSDAGLNYILKNNKTAREAYNRGRAAGGKSLFMAKPARASSKANGTKSGDESPKPSPVEIAVLNTIRQGIGTRVGLVRSTLFTFDEVEDALDVLAGRGIITFFTDGTGIEHVEVKKLPKRSLKPATTKKAARAGKPGRKKIHGGRNTHTRTRRPIVSTSSNSRHRRERPMICSRAYSMAWTS